MTIRGVTIASSGLNVAVFNSAMLTEYTTNLEPRSTTVDVHFRARGLGWTFWVCDDLLAPELREWKSAQRLPSAEACLRIAEAARDVCGEVFGRACGRRRLLTFARVTHGTRAAGICAHRLDGILTPVWHLKTDLRCTGTMAAAFLWLGGIFRR